MKKVFILITTLTLTLTLHAQNCKYQTDEVDKFTGTYNLVTKPKILFQSGILHAMTLKLRKHTRESIEVILLEVNRLTPGMEAIVVKTNDPIIFLLEDDTTIKLYPNDIYTGEPGYVQNSQFTTIKTLYILDTETINKMLSSPIKSCRFYYNDVYSERDIKIKKAIKVQELFNCIL